MLMASCQITPPYFFDTGHFFDATLPFDAFFAFCCRHAFSLFFFFFAHTNFVFAAFMRSAPRKNARVMQEVMTRRARAQRKDGAARLDASGTPEAR